MLRRPVLPAAIAVPTRRRHKHVLEDIPQALRAMPGVRPKRRPLHVQNNDGDLINICFGSLCGLRSGISRGRERARKRHMQCSKNCSPHDAVVSLHGLVLRKCQAQQAACLYVMLSSAVSNIFPAMGAGRITKHSVGGEL